MAVRCVGDSALLEQLGEKQDFECLLTVHGLRHEDFLLHVRRRPRGPAGPDWSRSYSVRVTCTKTGVRHVYLGGPPNEWLRRFSADVAKGVFDGPARAPTDPSFALARTGSTSRHARAGNLL